MHFVRSTLAPRFMLVSAIALVAAVGCSTPESEMPPIESQAAAEAEIAERSPIARLANLLGELELSEPQSAEVESILGDAETALKPTRAAFVKLARLYTAGTRAGDLDEAAIETARDELIAQIEKDEPAITALVQRLHAVLTPDQRAELVERIGDRDGHRHGRQRLEELVSHLELTEDQQDRIKGRVRTAVMGDWGALKERFAKMRDRAEDVGDAFEEEDFDAEALGLFDEAPAMVRTKTDRATQVVEILIDELNPTQRQKLADVADVRIDAIAAR